MIINMSPIGFSIVNCFCFIISWEINLWQTFRVKCSSLVRRVLLLWIREYWFTKKDLKCLAFILKFVTNLTMCYSGGIIFFFLSFKKFFSQNQYASKLFWALSSLLELLRRPYWKQWIGNKHLNMPRLVAI